MHGAADWVRQDRRGLHPVVAENCRGASPQAHRRPRNGKVPVLGAVSADDENRFYRRRDRMANRLGVTKVLPMQTLRVRGYSQRGITA